ncbi:heat-inducible transcriptional repressor HrcA [Bacillus fonticola]|uniref:heat-inducible transcriptional repressor HrcA n=1 Tax=Bacillus fonticola TaxID=2728853 RepID=UPI0014749935|nr:heat-inducible transcriptional repressor HrcA [Bacillus fonticola]
MLTDRQLFILQVIVNDFIQSAQPVGSRTLSKKEEVNFSSATIRNEMADLEELGFIEKTHSSSGRVPSEKGYRYYVDHLLAPQRLRGEELLKLRSFFRERMFEWEEVVSKAATLLSDLTSYTSIVLGANISDHHLKKIEMVPLNESRVLAIIITDGGHVEHKTIELSSPDAMDDLDKVANVLNERLEGVSISQLPEKASHEVQMLFRKHADHYQIWMEAMERALHINLQEKLAFGGKTIMFEQPEFHDVELVKAILSLMEDETAVSRLLKPRDGQGIHVSIGTELNVDAAKDLSLITATYALGSEKMGTIAVLGPKRMNYARVITTLDYFRQDLSTMMTNLYRLHK